MLAHAQQQTPIIESAYEHCQRIVRSHYENFPVASILLSPALRRPIAVIYAFARSADDFADEGDHTPEQRLHLLENYDNKLRNFDTIDKDDLIFIALHDVIEKHQLPIQLFHDLLSAFKQDVNKKRYLNFDEVLDYCSHSANPVGRLLLHMTNNTSDQFFRWSDAICSALQLINFLQDIEQDYVENNRIYIPQNDMAKFGVTEQYIREKICDAKMSGLYAQQVKRAKTLMLEGAPLGSEVTGRFGLQLRMMINGGLQVINRLERQTENCFSRPRLSAGNWIKIAFYAMLKQSIQ